MSFLKYFDQRDASHRGSLYWHRSGMDGAPFRSAMPLSLREEEFEDNAERVIDGRVRIFDLGKQEDLQEYQEIVDRAMNGWYIIARRDLQFIADKGSWLVYLEWGVPHMEIPKDKLVGINGG